MLIAAHYNPFGLRAFKRKCVFKTETNSKKMCIPTNVWPFLFCQGFTMYWKSKWSFTLSVSCLFFRLSSAKGEGPTTTANTWHQCSGEKGDQLSVRISLEKKGTKSFPAEHCSLFSKSETNSNTMRPNYLRNQIFMNYYFKFFILVSLNKYFNINVP